MERWTRDPVQILGLSQEFDSLSKILAGLSQAFDGYSDVIGATNVADAFSDIANNWWVERGKLVTELESACAALVKVAESYTDDDVSIVKSL